jgi:uncharacterized membrane protein
MSTFSIKEALSFGWQKTTENLGFIIGVTLINFIVGYIGRPGMNPGKWKYSASSLLVLAYLVLWIVSTIISIGFTKIFIKLSRGEKAEFKDLIQHYKLFWKYLISRIVTGTIFIVGLILLIVPGIIFALRYSMVPFLVVDKGMWVFPALEESSKLTYGHKWQLLKLSLCFIGINILGALALGVGLLISIPVTAFAFMHVYNKLLGIHTVAVTPSSSSVTPTAH